MLKLISRVRLVGSVILLATSTLVGPPAFAQYFSSPTARMIVETFANNAIANGEAVGAAVGVIKGGEVVTSAAYGLADVANNTPFRTNTLFEIASNTKVFTTNLLGQDVVNHRLSLTETLGQLSAQVGALKPLSEKVELEELADFTAGFPDLGLCSLTNVPGCLTSKRPPQSVYTVADFLTFFQNTVPMNYKLQNPVPLAALPGPYLYSNFSIGLLGLILATPSGPIGSGAVDAWYNRVKADILTPLRMSSTYLNIPTSIPAENVAAGYSPAKATATVSGGEIASIELSKYKGHHYSSTPEVTISGGGGTGARAQAQIDSNGEVASISVTAPGEYYIAPPDVLFNNGGSTSTAKASAIVENGKIVAFQIVEGGKGYQKIPDVTISGGRTSWGRDATGTAHIANGHVTAITIDDGGAGYLAPLRVVIAPGDAENNVIPVWAAAGALVSTLDDLEKFAMAAIGEPTIDGNPVPPVLTQGFRVAETPYACYEGNPPDLKTCPAGVNLSGLAWEIEPADSVNGMPEIVTKNGGLTGFSGQIVLAPSLDLAVVALVNSDDDVPALNLAFQVTYALIYAGKGLR